MPSAPTTSIDLGSADVVADPYPHFTAERERHEVAWHDGAGRWLTFSHAAAGAVLRDRALGRIWRDREPGTHLEPFNLLHRNQMMENEPPEHTRLRRAVAGAFNRGHVERLRPRVQELAASLLDEVGASSFDVIGAYAEPLPVLVIAELVAERRAAPADDLITDLVATELSEDEVVAAVVLLLNAGHEASVNVFGNGLVAMLRRGLRPGADLPATVEEMLRFDSALQLFERTATADVELGGVVVEAGDKVAVLLGAANRDPAVFDAPDEFRVDRTPNNHVAFGVGVHFCLGAPLARMELVESLGALWAAYPSLELAGEPESRGTFVLRGFRRVPVEGRPGGGAP
jgi:unspecific monooxygenase